MFARRYCVVAALGLLGLAGCGPPKLDVEKTFEFAGSGEVKAVDLPAIKQPQKVTVEFSSDGDVMVLIFNASDAESLEGASADKALAKTEKPTKSGSISADVPANTETRVVVRPQGKGPVKIHVTNKK